MTSRLCRNPSLCFLRARINTSWIYKSIWQAKMNIGNLLIFCPNSSKAHGGLILARGQGPGAEAQSTSPAHEATSALVPGPYKLHGCYAADPDPCDGTWILTTSAKPTGKPLKPSWRNGEAVVGLVRTPKPVEPLYASGAPAESQELHGAIRRQGAPGGSLSEWLWTHIQHMKNMCQHIYIYVLPVNRHIRTCTYMHVCAMVCCAVLCSAVQHCAVLCCAVLWCTLVCPSGVLGCACMRG